MLWSKRLTRSGFLLLEAIVACTIMSVMVMYIAQYQWYMHKQNIHISKQITALLATYTFFEEKSYLCELPGGKEGDIDEVDWHMLPTIKKGGVAVRPMQVTLYYTVAGKQHSFTLVSAV